MIWGTRSVVFWRGTSKAEQEAGQHTTSGSVGEGHGSPEEESLGER